MPTGKKGGKLFICECGEKAFEIWFCRSVLNLVHFDGKFFIEALDGLDIVFCAELGEGFCAVKLSEDVEFFVLVGDGLEIFVIAGETEFIDGLNAFVVGDGGIFEGFGVASGVCVATVGEFEGGFYVGDTLGDVIVVVGDFGRVRGFRFGDFKFVGFKGVEGVPDG